MYLILNYLSQSSRLAFPYISLEPSLRLYPWTLLSLELDTMLND